MTTLSLFALVCNADEIGQTTCESQFIDFSEESIIKYGFQENQMIYDYINREVEFKSELIISTLQSWERDRNIIGTSEITKILDDNFVFLSVEEINNEISVSQINMTMNDAIKRYVNIISTLGKMNDFLISPIFTITYDGENVDMSNAMEKQDSSKGPFLNEAQKYFYTFEINFQKYLQRLFNISENLYLYYEEKLNVTSKILLIFVLMFIFAHLFFLFLCLILLYKFKDIHSLFYSMIYLKITSEHFEKYLSNKYSNISILLMFFKEKPQSLIKKIEKAKINEKKENLKRMEEKKVHLVLSMENNTPNLHKNKKIQLSVSKEYFSFLMSNFFLRVAFLIFFYFAILLTFYLLLILRIKELSKMNRYARVNYDASNKVFLNIAFIQLMSMTNQTDEMLTDYFNSRNSSYVDDGGNKPQGFVRNNIQTAISLVTELNTLQKQNPSFGSLTTLIDVNCENLFEKIKDPIIESMVKKYPEYNYYSLFSKYCSQVFSLNKYHNALLALELISYSTSSLLDLFIGRTLEIYRNINNNDLLYQKYSDALMIIRPVRRFIYNYVSQDVISLIISSYIMVMVVFIVFNFVYEAVILLLTKLKIINSVIQYSKEIIILLKAFECFV